MFRRISIGIILTVLSLSMFPQDPWLTFGGPDNEEGFALCLTGDEGYLLAGSTRSYGQGSWDMYAVKLDGQGNLNWTKTFGWLHQDHFTSVIQLPDGYLFAGYAWDYGPGREDIYLLKTDLSGNKIFDQLYGSNLMELGFRVKASQTGGFIILGYSRSYELHGDIYMMKTDAQGNEIWRSNFGTDYDDYAYNFTELSDGSLVIFGSVGSFNDDVHYNYQRESADWILIRTDSEGDETWRKIFTGAGHDLARDIIARSAGGYYLFGSTMSEGAGSFDMLLMQVDENGNENWKKTFGGSDYEYGMSMDANADGDLYLLGSTKSFGQEGTPDFYLLKADGEGNVIWDLTLGGDLPDYGMQVQATADHGCAIFGKTGSYGAGGYDMLIAKVSADGMVEQLISGIDTSENEQAVIYPNPVAGTGKLKPDDPTIEYRMDLVSITGTTVFSQVLYPPKYRFHVETLPAELYVYRISASKVKNRMFSGKLMIR